MIDGTTQAAQLCKNVHCGLHFTLPGTKGDSRATGYLVRLTEHYDAGDAIRKMIAKTIDDNQRKATLEVVQFVRAAVELQKSKAPGEAAPWLDALAEQTEEVFRA
jgi:hypothetical protein